MNIQHINRSKFYFIHSIKNIFYRSSNQPLFQSDLYSQSKLTSITINK